MQIIFNYKIIFFIIILIAFKQIEIYAILWLFMLIHELGHIFIAKLLKLKLKKLYITPFGFNMILENEGKSLHNKLWLESAGLIVNMLLVIIGVIIKSNIITISNLAIFVFNIIPIYPLDGGRILKSILEEKMQNMRAEKIMNKISNITLIIVTALTSVIILKLHNFILILAIYYLWIVLIRENKRLKLKEKVYNIIETQRT